MDLAKKSLKIISYLEILLGLVFIGVGIYTMVNYAELASYFNDLELEGMDPKTAALIGSLIIAAFYFLYAYLLRLAIKDGNKTTLLIVLLVIGILVTISMLTKGFNIWSLISLLLHAYVLYQVIMLRKAAK